MEKTTFLALLALVVMFGSVLPTAGAQPRITSGNTIRIMDAYYGDLDADGYEDDIKLLVEFSLANTDPSRIDLNIWIELPSGLTYNFRVSVYRPPNQSILNIDCIDMATESGWYIVTMLASVMGTGNGKLYITDQLEFDPPTGTGPGLPKVEAYF